MGVLGLGTNQKFAWNNYGTSNRGSQQEVRYVSLELRVEIRLEIRMWVLLGFSG